MHQVLIARSAEKQLKKLPPQVQRKLAAVVMSLGIDPRPYGSNLSPRFEALRLSLTTY
jgi:mRNA-degrading endonuclease RelE of RelBE toxin-antitoxin system